MRLEKLIITELTDENRRKESRAEGQSDGLQKLRRSEQKQEAKARHRVFFQPYLWLIEASDSETLVRIQRLIDAVRQEFEGEDGCTHDLGSRCWAQGAAQRRVETGQVNNSRQNWMTMQKGYWKSHASLPSRSSHFSSRNMQIVTRQSDVTRKDKLVESWKRDRLNDNGKHCNCDSVLWMACTCFGICCAVCDFVVFCFVMFRSIFTRILYVMKINFPWLCDGGSEGKLDCMNST